jgi:hypothetical protein
MGRPGVDHVERQVAADPLGRLEAEEEAGPCPPAVPDQPGALQAEGVHDGDKISHPTGGVISPGWRVRPAEAAEVRADQTVVVGQPGDDVPPGVPMLREAVEQHDRLAGAGLRQVEADAPRLHEAVLHPLDVGERAGWGDSGLWRHAVLFRLRDG